MLFNSLNFAIFLPTVLFLYVIVPHRLRKYLLLISSYFFYMSWKPEYVILILLSTIIDYFCGFYLGKQQNLKKRRCILAISMFFNLGLLFIFKYFNFFYSNIHTVLFTGGEHYLIDLILPVGISFYTFQTMSYTIDVYFKKQDVEPNFITFATYVTYFPQLVAGPIERPQNLLEQFKRRYVLNYDNFKEGLRMILWGLFKKIVVADNISKYVDAVFNNTSNHTSFALIVAAYLFSLQIYCDFSGYSDIAIGVSKLFNINLMKNFQTPYFSRSITEFWRRWHISLSSWFRDYLYIPLGGGRVSMIRVYLNLMITFLVSGLWHGANWTFVVWGGIHGIFICLDKLIKRPLPVPNVIKVLVTAHIAVFAFVFFRADSIEHAMLFFKRLFLFDFNYLYEVKSLVNYSLSLLVLIIFDYKLGLKSFSEFLDEIPSGFKRRLIYTICLFMIIHFGNFYSESFIYFQF